ncbi:FAD/NAD(P)-binding domain-containing protein [Aspergillus heteromorphus CBS 117.55]|uniref:FAD/NAD(P)-binding domain-containing protein n=1 Tax=Aspergillus heteromorphus CBS 117.55 TaxID=1448321 RepID=A0A317WUK3_9EURO|nr:FAD/NAD(P)-binding domain-containing protein [Aspergillus heteromorphus CBS 117.55]PWY90103.1 FAD/NAD(P)-binding domain-containing protein [Aspergillus heteromorphus CBS 117.55]
MDGASDEHNQLHDFPAPRLDGINGAHIDRDGVSFHDRTFSDRSRKSSIDGTEREERSRRRFPRVSLPVELMRNSYDVVVIGSGYGGGVAASRMARGGQSVCVLERGKERWPGEFPEKLDDAMKEIHISGDFAPGDRRSLPGTMIDAGNPNGLYHFVVGEGQNVYMGNGLGGTSLLNANVFLEAHRKVLDMGIWPGELKGQDTWKKYYDRAKGVLEPAQYPVTFPSLHKADLLKKQSELMSWGDDFYRVPQTTRFEDGPNSTGVYMQASQLTGMDATGINDGSKSTTLVNYLSDAWNWGAEIFCECEVRYVAKAPDREGYIIYFAWHSCGRGRFPIFHEDLMWVHAKELVFFGAGSIGTTEILLRSKQMGLDLSDDLGTEMSGNGDMLGFGYNTDFEANCMARPGPTSDRPVGPCITSVLDRRDQKNPLDGYVVEDCAVPHALAPLMFSMLERLPDMIRPKYDIVEKTEKRVTRDIAKYFGPYAPEGSVQKTAVYLIMSHDSDQGRMVLKNDKPMLTYSGVGRSKSVSRIHDVLEKMTAAVGGNFIANPVWSTLGRQEITVHPIGGARISKDNTGNNGSVNHMGELLKGHGNETHEGLVVCDGTVLPAAVGVNPFATITAFAERSVELVAQKHNIDIDYDTKNGQLDMFNTPSFPFPQDDTGRERLAIRIEESVKNQTAGIEFTEIMIGHVYTGPDVKDFEVAAKLARGRCEAARFFLSVKSWSTEELVNSHLHPANMTGTFTCNSLGGVFMVNRGHFQMFNHDSRQPDTANLTYDFDMTSPGGRILHFNGYKVINTASFLNPLELSRQTTTLYVTITEPEGTVVGRGILHIEPDDFACQLRTLVASGPSFWSKASSTASFLAFFARHLSTPFLAALGRLQWPGTRLNYASREVTPSSTVPLTASDGVTTKMVMWNPISSDGKEVSGPAPIILMIPGAAVDHKIFALPTIEYNAVEYFREAGYRIYCVTHRVGRAAVAREGYTPYDARRDVYAALAHIRKMASTTSPNESPKVYVIAHCAGSLALSCGLLDGTIPSKWIQGITASMVFMNPKFGKVDSLLSGFPTSLYEHLVSPYWDCTSSRNDTYFQSLLNQALRLYPQGEARESCRSVVCHRSELVFGRLWTHSNLNDATHSQLERFLGGTSMRSLQWLMKTGQLENVAANGPAYTSLVTPENIDRLKGIPILFLSGTGNMVFTAENTDISYTTLCNAHGREWYEREVFTGRGHLDAWMGSTAYEDVYPRVKRHVDRVVREVRMPPAKLEKKRVV